MVEELSDEHIKDSSQQTVAPQQQMDTALQQSNSTAPKSEDSEKPKDKWFNPKDLELGSIDSYIDGRWNDQYIYFQKKANRSQKWFNFIQITILVLGFLSVFILAFDLDSFFKFDSTKFSVTKVLGAFMSGVIVVLTGLDKLKNFKEEWIKNRKAEEMLKREMDLYKEGSAPYLPLKEEAEEEEDSDEPDETPTSERTKKLITSLNDIAAKCDEDSVIKGYYQKIKKEIYDFLAAENAYSGSSDKITDKDKMFVSRINTIVEKNRQLVDEVNLSRNIQSEISDFYTDGGAYVIETSAEKKKKKKRLTLDDIIAENGRLLVARTEAIIANDVSEFVNAQTSHAKPEDKDKNENENDGKDK